MFRKQIESDLRKLQDEKRNVIVRYAVQFMVKLMMYGQKDWMLFPDRLQNSEIEQKENNREMLILQKKIVMLDAANSELLAQLFKLKYQETSNQLGFDELSIESAWYLNYRCISSTFIHKNNFFRCSTFPLIEYNCNFRFLIFCNVEFYFVDQLIPDISWKYTSG